MQVFFKSNAAKREIFNMSLRNLVLIFASLVFGAKESDLSPTIFGTLTFISLHDKRCYAHS